MTAPAEDEHVSGFGAPSAELERPGERSRRAGAHARRPEVAPVEAPRHPLPDRRRYFLSSFEPSGDYDAVIVAVTDGSRRRYFTTRDGDNLTEVDEVSFERRRESGTRSLLELDERELGELEAELRFVRPVRGRDPIAEVDGVDADAHADADGDESETVVESAAEVEWTAVRVEWTAAEEAESELEPAPEREPEATTEPEPTDEPWDAANGEPAVDSTPDEASEGTGDHAVDADMFEPLPATEPQASDAPEPAEPTDRTDEGETDDVDPMTEEFETMMMESTTATVERPFAAASDATGIAEPAPAPAPAPEAALSLTAAEAIAQVSLAKGIAFVAHRGQLDRSGLPYIDHPGRIAERFDPVAEPVESAAAWLHDVLEDTPVTEQELLEAGVLPEIVVVAQLLTRRPEVSPDEYYARIRRDPIALRVKLADIDDNTSAWRLRRLDYDMQVRLAEKYRYARHALGAE
ncbi:hypothetical protein [Agromyces sp. NPDC057865]|uniref:hypothetical protein n=1 Tax=Agromyces sp. NPDC057865 TaxID=3346267 RepID=UPI00366C3B77